VRPPSLPRPRPGLSRPGWGCALAALALALAFALWGHGLFRRGVRLAVARAVARVEARLPADLEPARRERLLEAMDRVTRSADAAAQGRFLAAAGAALEDGRIGPGEVVTLEAALGLQEGGR